MFAVFLALAVVAPAAGASAQCDSKPFTLGGKPQAKPAAKAPAPAPPKLAEAKPPAKKPATARPGVPGCKTDSK
ncbi:MAG TPA: hypothetical protein VFU87_00705 [Sphingomicrobium sp.]|nr:hypothetical protein [Sphingomicrobium sp.]